MPQLLHSVAVQEANIAADAIVSYDLPVNPLSVILLCLRPLNDTGTLSNFARYLDVCGAVNRVSVLHRGSSIFSMSGRDAAALNYFRHGLAPMSSNEDDTNNERRCVVLPILLGRFAYDHRSCFPQSNRGELVIELDLDVADTGYDTLNLSIETIELLGAKPKEFERKVTTSRTFAATGVNDVELAAGNVIRGMLLFGTTSFQGASPAPTLGRVEVRMDNQQAGYSATDIEVAGMIGQLLGRQPPRYDAHKHRTTTDGNAQTLVQTVGGPTEIGNGGWENYAYLDFDPTRDDEFALDTKGASQFSLRSNAEAAEAVRIITVEKMLAGAV